MLHQCPCGRIDSFIGRLASGADFCATIVVMATKLPPSLELFLGETSDEPIPPQAFASWMDRSGMAKEFEASAKATVMEFKYADTAPSRRNGEGPFRLCPSGALNPLSTIGKCSEPDCRADMAERFARSVALYGDEVFVPDELTRTFLFSDLTAPGIAVQLMAARASLRKLEPLLRAGIVRFGSPLQVYCRHCGEEIERFREAAVERLGKDMMREVRFSLSGGGRSRRLSFTLSAGKINWVRQITQKQAARLRSSPRFIKPNGAEKQFLRAYVDTVARMSVEDLFSSSTLAQRTRGTLAACVSEEARAFATVAGWKRSATDIDELERLQHIRLPYVEDLTVEELLILRRKASAALPRFRSFLSNRVLRDPDPQKVQASLKELKEGVEDVEAELRALRRGRTFKGAAATAMVALAVIVCETASMSGIVAAAFGGALAALNGLHPHLAKDEVDTARQEAVPSFVLWKARDLLRHR